MAFDDIINKIDIPKGIVVKEFNEIYFHGMQELYREEGWMTFLNRTDEAKKAWKNSQIALVVLKNNKVVGLLRAITDGYITTYLSEIIISKDLRGMGLGNILLEICNYMYPRTRIDLLSSETTNNFYRKSKFREITGFRKSYV